VVPKTFDYGTLEQRESMVAAIVPLVTEWGVHPQGCDVVGKAFDYGTAEQRESMAAAVVPLVTEWGVHPQGCNVVPKAFDYGTTEQRESMVAAITPLVTEWGVHPQGHEVVTKAFDFGTAEQRESMVAAIVPHAAAWACTRHGAWTLIPAVVHGNDAQREALIERCLPVVDWRMAVGGQTSHLLWEMLFAATAEQHAALYERLLPLVVALAQDSGRDPRGPKTLRYMITFGSKVQQQQIASTLRPLGLWMQQCGNCGNQIILKYASQENSESCSLCSMLPSVVAGDSDVALTQGKFMREAMREAKLLREYERLNPSHCTLHALRQLCCLAGATEIPTDGPGCTRRTIWEALGRFVHLR